MTLIKKVEERITDRQKAKEENTIQITNLQTKIDFLTGYNELIDVEIETLTTKFNSLKEVDNPKKID